MSKPVDRLTLIGRINQETLRAIEAGTAKPQTHPYFGYFRVDIFDCPPFVMFTNNDDPRAHNILYERKFEMGSMALWCRLARSATAILDIGAHVGVYALAAAALRPDLAVHAFEPNPHAYARLRVHKVVNVFRNIVEHPVAIGHTNAKAQFSWDKKPDLIPSGAKLGKFEEFGDAIERLQVPLHTLDSIVLETPGARPLIKIDVEGAERFVFAGMPGYLQARPDIILETFDQASCDEINQAVQPLGYSVYAIDEATGALNLQDRLTPRDRTGENFNQFLTVRETPPISS